MRVWISSYYVDVFFIICCYLPQIDTVTPLKELIIRLVRLVHFSAPPTSERQGVLGLCTITTFINLFIYLICGGIEATYKIRGASIMMTTLVALQNAKTWLFLNLCIILDASSLWSLCDLHREWQHWASASGELLGMNSTRAEIIEGLASQVLDLLASEEETSLQQIFIEQLAKIITSSSRTVWSQLRESSGVLM